MLPHRIMHTPIDTYATLPTNMRRHGIEVPVPTVAQWGQTPQATHPRRMSLTQQNLIDTHIDTREVSQANERIRSQYTAFSNGISQNRAMDGGIHALFTWANDQGHNLEDYLQEGDLTCWTWGRDRVSDFSWLGSTGIDAGPSDNSGRLEGIYRRELVVPDIILDTASRGRISYFEQTCQTFSPEAVETLRLFVRQWTTNIIREEPREHIGQAAPGSSTQAAIPTPPAPTAEEQRKARAVARGKEADDNKHLIRAYKRHYAPTDGSYENEASTFLSWLDTNGRSLVVGESQSRNRAIKERNRAIDDYLATLDRGAILSRNVIESIVEYLEAIEKTPPRMVINIDTLKSLGCPISYSMLKKPQVLTSGHTYSKSTLDQQITQREAEVLQQEEDLGEWIEPENRIDGEHIECGLSRTKHPIALRVPNLIIEELLSKARLHEVMLKNGNIPKILKIEGSDDLLHEPIVILREVSTNGKTYRPGMTISAGQALEWGGFHLKPSRGVLQNAAPNLALKQYIREVMKVVPA